MSKYSINYAGLMAQGAGGATVDTVEKLSSALPDMWCQSYRSMPGASAEIYIIGQTGYTYLYDMSAERVVVVYGLSIHNAVPRDKSRIKGFLGKISVSFPGRGNKGHLISHKQGGGMDINLIPQRPDINLGRSEAGKRYREMERYCSTNPGSFCFSRLLYGNPNWVPDEIEYGVLYNSKQFRVERFTNAAV